MTQKLVIPTIPSEPMFYEFNGQTVMTQVWQDYFLNLTDRVGGFTLQSDLLVESDSRGNLQSLQDLSDYIAGGDYIVITPDDAGGVIITISDSFLPDNVDGDDWIGVADDGDGSISLDNEGMESHVNFMTSLVGAV